MHLITTIKKLATKIPSQKLQKVGYIAIMVFGLMYNVLMPLDQTVAQENLLEGVSVKNLLKTAEFKATFPNTFSLTESLPARYETYVEATAYNSDPAQTDDTPCITANGFDVCEHGFENIIATNNLPLGARVRFPELHGDKIFYVMDRMNSRYTTRVDFWMVERSDALKFGLKRIKMEVL